VTPVEVTWSVAARELLTEVELAVLAGRNLAQIEIEVLASARLDEEAPAAARAYACGYRERASQNGHVRVPK
jgi:hypothetical protein